MWTLWLLLMAVGICLVLSLIDSPPARVPDRARCGGGANMLQPDDEGDYGRGGPR